MILFEFRELSLVFILQNHGLMLKPVLCVLLFPGDIKYNC